MAGEVEVEVPLLLDSDSGSKETGLVSRIWIESKKIWKIAAPAIFSRTVLYGMNVITQAFAGHLGDQELASISIAVTVISGFSFGLLLGMASALETLCGQAYGAKQYHMVGIYLQRSWIVLLGVAILLLPIYIFATPILKLTGQADDIAEQAGSVAIWLIPMHFAVAFHCSMQRYLQSQAKNAIVAYVAAVALVIHVFLCWLLVFKLQLGIVGAAFTLNISWWLVVSGTFSYIFCGFCPLTWSGFSKEAFTGLGQFVKLSTASGVMICLENWYYRLLLLLTGNLKDAEVAVDSLAICMNINGWEFMVPLGFFASTGVRVANELGAGNGAGAKFTTKVSVGTSLVIGIFFWALILTLNDKIALAFTSSTIILEAVNKLALLLAFTILLNSVQPILSGVAVGSGWQEYVAYINITSYYLIGLPLGVFLGWVFNLGVMGIWGGMIVGTAVQTLALAYITIRCDWDKEAKKATLRMSEEGEGQVRP